MRVINCMCHVVTIHNVCSSMCHIYIYAVLNITFSDLHKNICSKCTHRSDHWKIHQNRICHWKLKLTKLKLAHWLQSASLYLKKSENLQKLWSAFSSDRIAFSRFSCVPKFRLSEFNLRWDSDALVLKSIMNERNELHVQLAFSCTGSSRFPFWDYKDRVWEN